MKPERQRIFRIEIDNDAADDVVRASMLDLYESLKDERCKMTARGRGRILGPAFAEELNQRKEDLEHNKTLLAAVTTIIKHITAHHDLPKELK